jgi:Family of unknown function (DUF6504)
VAKRYDESIEVTEDPVREGAPISFSWRGRRYEVDQWREAGEWWLAAGGSNGSSPDGSVRERHFFRVVARPAGALATGELDPDGFMTHVGAVYDMYFDRVRRQWRLTRVWD